MKKQRACGIENYWIHSIKFVYPVFTA